MSNTIEMHVGAELPDATLTLKDTEGNLINFATGWTFTLRIGTDPVTVKSSGITGAATDPNVTLTWSVDELNITPGGYRALLTATRTADSKDRMFEFTLRVRSAV